MRSFVDAILSLSVARSDAMLAVATATRRRAPELAASMQTRWERREGSASQDWRPITENDQRRLEDIRSSNLLKKVNSFNQFQIYF